MISNTTSQKYAPVHFSSHIFIVNKALYVDGYGLSVGRHEFLQLLTLGGQPDHRLRPCKGIHPVLGLPFLCEVVHKHSVKVTPSKVMVRLHSQQLDATYCRQVNYFSKY